MSDAPRFAIPAVLAKIGPCAETAHRGCASAVAAIASGRCTSPVEVIAPGGVQTVRWEGNVFLRGEAQLVCRGEFFI